MKDSTTMGSLAEKLMGYISTAPQQDTNYNIAVTMLEHYDKMKNMSIGDVADLCFVSKASISRFCRFMGFDSFRELHDCLQQEYTLNTDYSRSFFEKLCADPQRALNDYSAEILQNIQATVDAENIERISDILLALSSCDHIAYFSHHFLWDIGRHLQSKMIRMNRYIELHLDYAAQLTCARSLKKNDLAIVCSVGGSYPLRYPSIWNAVISSGCSVLVITQNASSPYWNQARFVLRCGVSNRNDGGKYGALMATDLLALSYLRRYGREFY